MEAKVLAICLKTYIKEDNLDEFLKRERSILTGDDLYIKGNEYYVNGKYYDKRYFKLIEKIG